MEPKLLIKKVFHCFDRRGESVLNLDKNTGPGIYVVLHFGGTLMSAAKYRTP